MVKLELLHLFLVFYLERKDRVQEKRQGLPIQRAGVRCGLGQVTSRFRISVSPSVNYKERTRESNIL